MNGRELKDHTLEFLLVFDGLIHWLENGYSLRFVIKKVNQTPTRRTASTTPSPFTTAKESEYWDSTTRIRSAARARSTKRKRPPRIVGIGPQPTRAGRTNSSMPTRSWRTFSKKSIASSRSGRFPPTF